MKKTRFTERVWKSLTTAFGALLAAILVMYGATSETARNDRIMLNAVYQRAFYETCELVSGVQSNLKKLSVAGNSRKRLELLSDIAKPSLMTLHIPLYEFNAVLLNAARTRMRGEYNERVSASELNSGLFAAVLQRGDVKGIFAGHDHINTFDGVYCGVRLGFCGFSVE